MNKIQKRIINSLLFIFFTTKFSFSQSPKKTDTLVVKTSSICGTCKNNLEKAMAYEKGVKTSKLNLEAKELTVIYNPQKTNPEKIRKAVSEAGYDADDIPANPKAYQKLDACCKKENQFHH